MEKVKFKNLLNFNKKSRLKANEDDKNGKYPFYTSSNIVSKKTSNPIYSDKSLVFGNGGSANIHFAEIPFSATSHCYIATAKSKNTNIKYVYYYLLSNIYILERGFKGAGLKNISSKYIDEIEIPLPDLETQNKIVAILDKAKNILEKRERTILMYDELLRATFFDMFGDPVRNEKVFDLKNLTEFYIDKKNGTKCGPFGSALKIEDYSEKGIPVWNMDNISKKMDFNPKPRLFIPFEKYNELERYNVVNDDIIISRAGTVGKMCIVKSEYEYSILSTNLIRLRLNKNLLLPEYFIYLMKYSDGGIIRLKKGSEESFSHMNTGILDSIVFPYPQINLQKEFKKIHSKIEFGKAKLNQSKTKVETLFNSISQSAFKGDLAVNKKETKN